MITGRAPARTALVGNPSDGYGGAVLTVAVENWGAIVELHERPGATVDRVEGPEGLVRIVEATRRIFRRRVGSAAPADLTLRTSVPREVGLAGSSAVVVATLDATAQQAGVHLDAASWPSLALHVETDELGIPGGLQDRVAQVWGGVVLCDARPTVTRRISGLVVGAYRYLPTGSLPPLAVAWLPSGREPSAISQAGLRAGLEDPEVVATFARLGQLAVEAADGLEVGRAVLAAAMDATMASRRRLVRLQPVHAELVERLGATGASVNYSGSGGAVVSTIPDGDLGRLEAAADAIGARIERLRIAPPRFGIS